ncbi:hypothetical protein ACFV2U_21220 [Streptomyces sp. NPDC059697]|uniref:hypothetical protein n=1 Tax=Streptomyces sp. NPDC059697 TaxID=3346912 RepID=UPI0036C0169F
MRVAIPGALADFLARTDLNTGPAAADPAAPAARAALDAGRRGRGSTLVITPSSTAVLQFISAFAELILTNREWRTPAEIRAARVWLDRAGRATSTLATDLAAAETEAQQAAALVTEAEATHGTWRGAWIGQQADDGLFALDLPAEQGALFDDRAAESAVEDAPEQPAEEPLAAPEVTSAYVDAYLARTYPALFTPERPQPLAQTPRTTASRRSDTPTGPTSTEGGPQPNRSSTNDRPATTNCHGRAACGGSNGPGSSARTRQGAATEAR